MCTVSWIHRPGGYDLLCNRDEKRTRGRALGPQMLERGGVKYIAPIDSDFGGTWLSVNEYGVSLCLLNAARTGPTLTARSRGLLLRELAWEPSAADCALWTRQLDLRLFAPFSLAILEPGVPTTVARWDGQAVEFDPDGDRQMPLTSSSYDEPGVRRSRLAEFTRRVNSTTRVDAALLYWFHASHGESPDAYSTCMHRADAETVSFSWVTVTQDTIRFLYSPTSPCQCSPGDQQILPRAA